jgi:hypothetical protein
MVHLNNPGTDYPLKALHRHIQSDEEAFNTLCDNITLAILARNEEDQATEVTTLANAIRRYVHTVASLVRLKDKG